MPAAHVISETSRYKIVYTPLKIGKRVSPSGLVKFSARFSDHLLKSKLSPDQANVLILPQPGGLVPPPPPLTPSLGELIKVQQTYIIFLFKLGIRFFKGVGEGGGCYLGSRYQWGIIPINVAIGGLELN